MINLIFEVLFISISTFTMINDSSILYSFYKIVSNSPKSIDKI